MEDGAEFSGRTVSDAISEAEASLGIDRAELNIEVITPGRGGVFGIGAEPARIRVLKQAAVAATEPVTEAPLREPVAAAATREGRDEPTVVTSLAQPPAADVGDLPEAAAEVLRRLLDSMGFDAEVIIRSRAEPVMLAVTGENLGVLIGRRGDNLAALQFMVNLILSKNRRQWPRVVIDIENYRARREESLRSLAERIAYRVQRNGRPFTLEAMSASDRRVIHLSLRENDEIETYSIGEGIARRVVVAPRRQQDVS